MIDITIWLVIGLCLGYVISMVCMASGRAELEQENLMLKEQVKKFEHLFRNLTKREGGK